MDKNVIKVDGHEGVIKELRLQVKEACLNTQRLVVEYENGTREKIKFKHPFQERK